MVTFSGTKFRINDRLTPVDARDKTRNTITQCLAGSAVFFMAMVPSAGLAAQSASAQQNPASISAQAVTTQANLIAMTAIVKAINHEVMNGKIKPVDQVKLAKSIEAINTSADVAAAVPGGNYTVISKPSAVARMAAYNWLKTQSETTLSSIFGAGSITPAAMVQVRDMVLRDTYNQTHGDQVTTLMTADNTAKFSDECNGNQQDDDKLGWQPCG
jgi:hypothetical protein